MSSRSSGPLREPYLKLKEASDSNLKSETTSDRLLDLIITSLKFLEEECQVVGLSSRVPGKSYVSYEKKSQGMGFSRPVNQALFNPDPAKVSAQWRQWVSGKAAEKSLTYTMVTAYCVASDLFDRNNKKGPATYFEVFVGHLFARALDVNPTKAATLTVDKRRVRLTMDYLFDLGSGKTKIHLPVKMSTRERVVQAWAHQRLLDEAFGRGTYKGILVVHSETKLDLVTKEVVEICVPDQWLAYQTYLAQMERIYYFDIPERYSQLATEYPIIKLKHFSEFFTEKSQVLPVVVH